MGVWPLAPYLAAAQDRAVLAYDGWQGSSPRAWPAFLHIGL
jgi:hypothetical protein